MSWPALSTYWSPRYKKNLIIYFLYFQIERDWKIFMIFTRRILWRSFGGREVFLLISHFYKKRSQQKIRTKRILPTSTGNDRSLFFIFFAVLPRGNCKHTRNTCWIFLLPSGGGRATISQYNKYIFRIQYIVSHSIDLYYKDKRFSLDNNLQ